MKDRDGNHPKVYQFVGLGGVRVSFDEATLCAEATANKNQTSFAYQIGAGIALPVADDIMIDVHYRYFDIADFAIAPEGAQKSFWTGFLAVLMRQIRSIM